MVRAGNSDWLLGHQFSWSTSPAVCSCSFEYRECTWKIFFPVSNVFGCLSRMLRVHRSLYRWKWIIIAIVNSSVFPEKLRSIFTIFFRQFTPFRSVRFTRIRRWIRTFDWWLWEWYFIRRNRTAWWGKGTRENLWKMSTSGTKNYWHLLTRITTSLSGWRGSTSVDRPDTRLSEALATLRGPAPWIATKDSPVHSLLLTKLRICSFFFFIQ